MGEWKDGQREAEGTVEDALNSELEERQCDYRRYPAADQAASSSSYSVFMKKKVTLFHGYFF